MKTIYDTIHEIMTVTSTSFMRDPKKLAEVIVNNGCTVSYKSENDGYVTVKLINKFDEIDMYPILMSDKVLNQFKKDLREVKIVTL